MTYENLDGTKWPVAAETGIKSIYPPSLANADHIRLNEEHDGYCEVEFINKDGQIMYVVERANYRIKKNLGENDGEFVILVSSE